MGGTFGIAEGGSPPLNVGGSTCIFLGPAEIEHVFQGVKMKPSYDEVAILRCGGSHPLALLFEYIYKEDDMDEIQIKLA